MQICEVSTATAHRIYRQVPWTNSFPPQMGHGTDSAARIFVLIEPAEDVLDVPESGFFGDSHTVSFKFSPTFSLVLVTEYLISQFSPKTIFRSSPLNRSHASDRSSFCSSGSARFGLKLKETTEIFKSFVIGSSLSNRYI